MSKTFRVNNHIKIEVYDSALSAKQTIVPIVAKLRKPCQNFLVCILGLPNFICVRLNGKRKRELCVDCEKFAGFVEFPIVSGVAIVGVRREELY